ncbi:DUF1822 family protein [Capilliphycus salinus ALCB114379]|uniref:DUF1822 family protein n=1 Tax=Capilliphycus salinus TaxID=2768948 RepID=UPI0039A7595A
MLENQNATKDFRFTLSEAILLEAEDFERAMAVSNPVIEEDKQWQTYLNALALLGLERWFNERLSSGQIDQNLDSSREEIGSFQFGKFKIGVIAVEQVLDEAVSFPQNLFVQPERLADFYVLAEVMEEEEEIIFQGAISQQKLLTLTQNCRYRSSQTDYLIPLDEFDIEPNHLLFYCKFLQSEIITTSPEVVPDSQANFQQNIAKISDWFKNIFESAWQPLEALVSPELSLAFNTRCVSEEIRRGKLINLGMKLNHRRFIMLVTVAAEAEEKRRVLVQLHPTVEDEYLPPGVQLTLLSKEGKIYQEVTSRSRDNYIQLNPFKGKSGKQFSIEVSWNDTGIREEFEL